MPFFSFLMWSSTDSLCALCGVHTNLFVKPLVQGAPHSASICAAIATTQADLCGQSTHSVLVPLEARSGKSRGDHLIAIARLLKMVRSTSSFELSLMCQRPPTDSQHECCALKQSSRASPVGNTSESRCPLTRRTHAILCELHLWRSDKRTVRAYETINLSCSLAVLLVMVCCPVFCNRTAAASATL